MTNTLLDIRGVGPAIAQLLTETGFADIASIANAEPQALAALRGIGPVSAATIQIGAQQLLAASEPEPASVASDEPSKTSKRAKKLQKRAKQLRQQADGLTKKAKATKSKKKRKQRLRRAAELKASAKKARRKAKKLLG